jgi:hypothetical protein
MRTIYFYLKKVSAEDNNRFRFFKENLVISLDSYEIIIVFVSQWNTAYIFQYFLVVLTLFAKFISFTKSFSLKKLCEDLSVSMATALKANLVFFIYS